jgi:hypothetical protein
MPAVLRLVIRKRDYGLEKEVEESLRVCGFAPKLVLEGTISTGRYFSRNHERALCGII